MSETTGSALPSSRAKLCQICSKDLPKGKRKYCNENCALVGRIRNRPLRCNAKQKPKRFNFLKQGYGR